MTSGGDCGLHAVTVNNPAFFRPLVAADFGNLDALLTHQANVCRRVDVFG